MVAPIRPLLSSLSIVRLSILAIEPDTLIVSIDTDGDNFSDESISYSRIASAGFTGYVGVGAPNLFAEINGDSLTLNMDDDGDAQIDQTIQFERL